MELLLIMLFLLILLLVVRKDNGINPQNKVAPSQDIRKYPQDEIINPEDKVVKPRRKSSYLGFNGKARARRKCYVSLKRALGIYRK